MALGLIDIQVQESAYEVYLGALIGVALTDASAGVMVAAATNAPQAPIRYSNTNVAQPPYSNGVVQPYRPHLPESVLRPQPASSNEYELQEPQPRHPGY